MKERNSAGLSSHCLTSLRSLGLCFFSSSPSPTSLFFLVLERNLFVFKSKINELSEMAAMLLEVHMGRKCGSLQKAA